jgi:hypothetical protein
MNNGRLTVWIGEFEALPVRGIPYVGGWTRFFPNRTVDYLSRKDNFTPRCASLTAYHRPDGNTPVPVEPREWNRVAVKLKAFEAKLREQYSDNNIGYDAWQNGAVAILPPSAFVWLDEFVRAFQADLEHTDFSNKQPGVDELTFTPMLDADTRAMVMEGFDMPPMVTEQEPEAAATKVETAQAATTKDGELVAKPGRPPSINMKAAILRQIVTAAESITGERFDAGPLPGSAADLLEACQIIEKALTGKATKMAASTETFKNWLRVAGYSFSTGRTPTDQTIFWTHLAPEITAKINPQVFTGVIPETPS